MSSMKNFITCANERGKYYELLLSGDVETVNPGLTVVNPTKTISAPYSQSNAEVFEVINAGRQCVALSLSALISVSRKLISSVADLVQIMNTGNDLYSTLSKSAREPFLLLTKFYQLWADCSK